MSNVSVGSKTEAAGWRLISASFLTPNYDITFSMVNPAERYKRRRKKDVCLDQRDLPNSTEEPIFFFGGKDYARSFANSRMACEVDALCFTIQNWRPTRLAAWLNVTVAEIPEPPSRAC